MTRCERDRSDRSAIGPLPAELWKDLEAKAKAQGLSLHLAPRVAILEGAKRAP